MRLNRFKQINISIVDINPFLGNKDGFKAISMPWAPIVHYFWTHPKLSGLSGVEKFLFQFLILRAINEGKLNYKVDTASIQLAYNISTSRLQGHFQALVIKGLISPFRADEDLREDKIPSTSCLGTFLNSENAKEIQNSHKDNTPRKPRIRKDLSAQKESPFWLRLETIFEKYPYRTDSGKTEGLVKILKQIKNDDDLARFEKSVCNYAALVKSKDTQNDYIFKFKNFCAETKWCDFVHIADQRSRTDIILEEMSKED